MFMLSVTLKKWLIYATKMTESQQRNCKQLSSGTNLISGQVWETPHYLVGLCSPSLTLQKERRTTSVTASSAGSCKGAWEGPASRRPCPSCYPAAGLQQQQGLACHTNLWSPTPAAVSVLGHLQAVSSKHLQL